MTTTPLRLLILGGTAFVGRALTEAALREGHDVTLFNRGKTNAELFPEVRKLRGDRTSDLSRLVGLHWDAVVDVAAYQPEVARLSLDALRHAVTRYVFVSTVSVYADHSSTQSQQEDAPVLRLSAETPSADLYGARKAACESLVLSAFGDGATVVRPGLIVGPHDPTVRFAYWPRRCESGGRVLAPGAPDDPVQFIDVRDLAEWLLHVVVHEVGGVFNATGPPLRFQEFITACLVPGVDTEVTWVTSDHLRQSGVDPWMGVPLWIGGAGWEGANMVDSAKAVAAGLRYRSLAETISGAREHHSGAPLPFPSEAERELLERFSPS